MKVTVTVHGWQQAPRPGLLRSQSTQGMVQEVPVSVLASPGTA